MRLIDADALREHMYQEAFETDTDEQRWDSGCWIRYKMFERNIDNEITIDPVKWIPVSERLPEVGRNVLLSVGKGLYTAEGNLRDDGTWVQYRWSANIENVDAWTEMPEPWRGEEDG